MLDSEYENTLLVQGSYQRVIGIDEVGRGCLAGPVAVGAYVHYLNTPQIFGVDDSKKLLPKTRSTISSQLISADCEYYVKYAEASKVDDLGIANAIAGLITDLVNALGDQHTLFLVDGVFKQKFGSHVQKIIKGDEKYYSIAAASILAKVARDNWMTLIIKDYPGFSFDKHKGYGTKQHLQELNLYGVTDLHRRSFAPVAEIDRLYNRSE